MSVVPLFKTCPVCRVNKAADQWHRSKIRYDGLATRCKDCHRAAYGATHAERATERMRLYRAAAIWVYGARCVNCWTTNDLELDHVNGDGHEHRQREHVQKMYVRIHRTMRRLDDVELQLLCHECHWVKTRQNREYRLALR